MSAMYRNPPLNAFDGFLSALRPPTALLLALGLVVCIAAADYLTGYDMSLASLYLVPIFIVAWPLGPHAAVVMAIISAVAWFMSIVFMQPTHVSPLLQFWDGGIQLAVFLVFGLLIAKLKSALEQADDRFVTVLEGLDAAIHVSDVATGEILYANRRFREDFRDATAPPALEPGKEQCEFLDPGSGKWYLVESRPLRWTDGRPVRLHLAADISERKQADALFRAQQEKMQLSARLIMAGELATTLAHELNQPLGAIRNYIVGCIRWLRAHELGEAEVTGALRSAAAQAERAAAVIQRLRSMVARRPAHAEPRDIDEVIRGVAPVIDAEAQQRGATLRLELGARHATVRMDPILVEQVLLNLTRNAMDAMEALPPGERTVVIRSRHDPDGRIFVDVQDGGPGIDAELERKLFTPFFSTKTHGMGLGLHICRSIVEAHGGHITIRRAEGKGSIFSFSLGAAYV